jgi:hypothetical protein
LHLEEPLTRKEGKVVNVLYKNEKYEYCTVEGEKRMQREGMGKKEEG